MDNLWLKVENLVTKGKLLVLSNFFFFVTMFSKSRLLQRHQKASIWGKGLKNNFSLSHYVCNFVSVILMNFSRPFSLIFFSKQTTQQVASQKKVYINSFPHTDAFWCLNSRQLLETLLQEKIGHKKQFFLLPQCFQLLINY